jgi:N utilization substance protein A
MKSEFLLAFNEICESRGLPKEEVIDALKTALISAYRRDNNVSNSQAVTVEIDPRTGDPTIYAEKEVVDDVMDNRTEVTLTHARAAGYTDAEYGDLVMVDSTTASFGRIAAQTAKQVLLQRVREAEREQLYEDFSGREGELVNGTVQSVSGQHLTIGLGRTEAILPKSQQVPRERYRAHDKIRVYVLEVRRTNRGPQIFVSRNHRNLLRRLLELEVPEIYNGQVEIKSIAREAGQRSKVAVQALQPGVDPVGACVGMRGVRIQSIVRELNDEKIDVIEWDVDQRTFIAKALSPARVSHVFLDDDPHEGKTAVVIVPDDQLSLAIGREGQNARLAAKLTGWRIDIKSLTEAAAESLNNLDHPAVDKALAQNSDMVEKVQQIIAKKEAGRPITSEDFLYLSRLVGDVEGKIISSRAASHEDMRRRRARARRAVPEAAWQIPLDELDLPGRIHNLLLDNEVETVGDVIMVLEVGEELFLSFRGLDRAALAIVRDHLTQYSLPHDAQTAVVTPTDEPILVAEPVADLAVELEEEFRETAVAEEELPLTIEDSTAQVSATEEPTSELVAPIPVAVATEPIVETEEEDVDFVSEIDDLSRSLVEMGSDAISRRKGVIKVVPTEETEDTDSDDKKKGKKGRKGKQLVYDENAGEVVTKRKRKGSRLREEWDDFEDF